MESSNFRFENGQIFQYFIMFDRKVSFLIRYWFLLLFIYFISYDKISFIKVRLLDNFKYLYSITTDYIYSSEIIQLIFVKTLCISSLNIVVTEVTNFFISLLSRIKYSSAYQIPCITTIMYEICN